MQKSEEDFWLQPVLCEPGLWELSLRVQLLRKKMTNELNKARRILTKTICFFRSIKKELVHTEPGVSSVQHLWDELDVQLWVRPDPRHMCWESSSARIGPVPKPCSVWGAPASNQRIYTSQWVQCVGGQRRQTQRRMCGIHFCVWFPLCCLTQLEHTGIWQQSGRVGEKCTKNKRSCLEPGLPGSCQTLRLSEPLMFCKVQRAKHLSSTRGNSQETGPAPAFGGDHRLI